MTPSLEMTSLKGEVEANILRYRNGQLGNLSMIKLLTNRWAIAEEVYEG